MMKTLILFFLGWMALSPLTINAAVWTVENQWNPTWEERYADWIATDVDEHMFKSTKIKVDCADLCYTIRAIFARNNHLPFLASDLNGRKVSQSSSRWNDLSIHQDWRRDRRILAFLRYLNAHVSTKSFPHDTYPVELTTDTVKPGLLIYENLIAAHACFIARIEASVITPIVFFEASVPPKNKFTRSATLNIYIYKNDRGNENSGVVRWRWPVKKSTRWVYQSQEHMPFYSKEIYEPSYPHKKDILKSLIQIAKKKMNIAKISWKEQIGEWMQLFQQEIQFRSNIVNKAQTILHKQKENFQSKSFEYKYGTGSRDKRLYRMASRVWETIGNKKKRWQWFINQLKQKQVELYREWPSVPLLCCFITVDRHWLSPNAYASLRSRWGFHWDTQAKAWRFKYNIPFKTIQSWYEKAHTRGDIFDFYHQFKNSR